MTILVLGATGTTGSAVVGRLAAGGAKVRILTRDSGNAARLPDGLDVRVGDLAQPSDLGPVFDAIDAMFLLNALSPSETQQGLGALEWARLKGVKKVVYMSVQHAERAPHIPHFGSKVAIELGLKASGIDYTILQPNSFFQNDYRYKDAILGHGVYPQPIGDVGLDRVDVGDIAEAAVKALTPGAQRNRSYVVAGPEPLTGAGSAAAYAAALGRPVRYLGNDLDAWERAVLQHLPAWMVFDLKIMYRFFQQEGLRISARERDDFQALLGRSPRPFGDFVQELVASWS